MTQRRRPGAWLWNRSLLARVLVLTTVLSIASVGGVAYFLADQISERLFEAKRSQILVDADRSASDFDRAVAAMDATSASAIEQFLRDEVRRLERDEQGAQRDVLLLRNGNNDSDMRLLDVAGRSQAVISDDLAEQLRTSTGQFLQPVQLDREDRAVPGIVVGKQIAVPNAGPYDLYLVYDLAAEQATLDSVQRVLALATVVLVLAVVGIAALVTRFVVTPLRQAASAANRLAGGDLDERLPVTTDDELATLARSFNDMAGALQDQIERMEELSRLQRRFVSDVSHELRTPLTTIRMAAEVIHSDADGLGDAARRSSELLGNQLDRFEQLLADLLEISRFDAGAAELDLDEVDLVGLTDGVLDMMRPLAEARNVDVHVRLSDPTVRATCDRLRVERVLRNLVANAIEHADGKPLHVTVAASSTAVAVSVRDHGVGLQPGDLEHVFDRFWRADPARTRTTGGTGLGLSIAREDARLHRGYLEAWGRPGEGAMFRLTLPRDATTTAIISPIAMPDRGHTIEPHAATSRQTTADTTRQVTS